MDSANCRVSLTSFFRSKMMSLLGESAKISRREHQLLAGDGDEDGGPFARHNNAELVGRPANCRGRGDCYGIEEAQPVLR
jgi:hypothetical protein